MLDALSVWFVAIVVLLYAFIYVRSRGPREGKLTKEIRRLRHDMNVERNRARKGYLIVFPILFIITASVFIAFSPISTLDSMLQEDDLAEADPLLPDIEFPTIWEPPYINMTLAGEGDESADSIPEFAETTDDDTMLYPDSDDTLDQYVTDTHQVSTDCETTSGWVQEGSYDLDVFVVSGTQLYMNTTNDGDGPTVSYARAWDHADITTSWTDDYKYYVKFYYSFSVGSFSMQIEFEDGTYTDYFRMTEYDADEWHTVVLDSPVHNNIDSLAELQIYFLALGDTEAGELWIEYISIRSPINYDETGGYLESFAAVSDLSSPPEGAGTDGDVGYFDIPDDNAYDYWYTNEISLPVGSYTVEFQAKSNATPISYMGLWASDDLGGALKGLTGYVYLTTSFVTYNFHFTTTVIGECLGWVAKDTEANRISFDYLRIGLSTEMGWQHDGSTTGAITHTTSANMEFTESSDSDILTMNATMINSYSYTYRYYMAYDTTATACDLNRDYYPFGELRYRVTQFTGLAGLYLTTSMGGYYATIGLDTSGDWTTLGWNQQAAGSVASEQRLSFFAAFDAEGDAFVIETDWAKYYSIANFTVTDINDEDITDVVYVDNGVLVVDGTLSDRIAFHHNPALSISGLTYNVWNATVNTASGFRMHIYDGAWTDYDVGATRSTSPTGTITDIQFRAYIGGIRISAIKFWEDAVAPTIEEKWSTPQDPDTGDDVTISIVTTDLMGVYEATATPLSEPSGSNIGTQTFTLIDENPNNAMLWAVTIDDTDLIEGLYTFEIDASDAANSDYGYLTFTVSAATVATYIRIFDSLGDFVPFETFEVYRNGTRQYTDTFLGDTESAYQIQVKDRWGETLNTTTFAAGEQELVVTVEVYSLKIMSWHYDFVRFNVTRAGLTYSEIVTPLEVINFRLYTNTYDWAIDYLNGSSASGNIALTNSTALIVTGSTISDVFGLVTTVNTMTTAINITTTTISNEVVTVQLMFDWSNTTLYNQSINIIAAFNWENTTLYNQTISIASLFNATNTVLYDQIILIQNMFNWENTTLYNQTISILNAFNATNTVLYSQTVSILADISNVNSTIYAQTVQMLLDLENSNSTLYDQTVTLLANIANVDSDIAAQTVTILADIDNVNSTIYAQTVQMLTDINNMNSTIYSQTVMILSNLEHLNATVYLVDDPTHLNPLVLGHSLSDDYCDLTIVTNWHNASVSVYDNDVLRTGPTSELLCPIRYPLLATAGTHNLSIFVDGSNDSFWYNISYTVAEIIAFELEDWDVTPHLGVENHLECFFRTTWANSTVYVYLNDSLQTSVLEQDGGISFSFWMTGTPGLHQYVFNVTSGANVITITWDFYLPDWAETALVVRWDLWTFQNNYTMLELESNWMNCTYYIYLNSSLVATSANDPVTLNFTRAINIGEYNLTIYADGGTQTYTISNIRYIVTEEGVTYDFSSVTGGRVTIVGDTYEGDNVTIHENPTGMFVDQATAAIIAVGGFLIIFTAFLVAREIRKRDQEKTERMYSQ